MPPNYNIETQKLVRSEVVSRMSDSERAQRKSTKIPFENLRDVQESYLSKEDDAKTGLFILRGTTGALKTLIAVGGAAATGANPVTYVLMEQAIGFGLDEMVRLIEEEGTKSRANSLEKALGRYALEHGVDSLAVFNEDEAAPELLVKLAEEKFIPDLELNKDLSTDGKSVFNEAAIKELRKIQKRGLVEIAKNASKLKDLETSYAELEEDAKRIDAVSQTAKNHAENLKSVNAAIVEINSGLSEVRSRVDLNSEQILENRADIEFLQETLFGQLPPHKQRDALKAGFFPDMSDAEREKQLKRLDITTKRIELAEGISRYASYASDFANIARNLRLSSDVTKVLDRASAIGNIAAQTATAYATGNYIHAISAFSNIAGLGSQSPESQRHQQVVGMLKSIIEQNTIIDQKLDVALEQQRQLAENQKLILDGIIALGDQVAKLSEDLQAATSDIVSEIVINRAGIRQGLIGGLTSCDDLLFDEEFQKKPESFLQAKTFFESSWQLHMNCFEGIIDNVDRPLGLSNTQLYLVDYWIDVGSVTDPAKAREYSKRWLSDSRSLIDLVEKVSPALSVPKLFSALMNPCVGANDVQEKYDELLVSEAFLVERWSEVLRIYGGNEFSKLFQQYYSIDATITIARFFQRFGLYFEIQDRRNPSNLLSFDDLLSGATPSRSLSILLNGIVCRLDVLIAQQVMRSGDIFLPVLYEGYLRDEFREQVVSLLAGNEILAQNFVSYSVCRAVREKKLSELDYETLLKSPIEYDKWLRELFPDPIWDFAWKGEFSVGKADNQAEEVKENGKGAFVGRQNVGLRFSHPSGYSIGVSMPNRSGIENPVLLQYPQVGRALSVHAQYLENIALSSLHSDDLARRAERESAVILGIDFLQISKLEKQRATPQ